MATTTGMSNEAYEASYLRGKGLSNADTAGILGNWEVESTWNPTAYNANEKAIGIAQWEGGRRTALQQFAAARGTTETDLQTQLDFFWHEYTGGYASTYADMRATGSPSVAAAEFDQGYEGSSGSTRSERVNNAVTIFNQLAQGSPLTGGSSTVQGSAALSSGDNGAHYGDGKAIPGTSPPIVDPPIDPANLKPPLDQSTRNAIIEWCKSTHLGAFNSTNWNTISDAALLDHYKSAIKALNWKPSNIPIIGGALGWADSLGKILSWLTTLKNWERIGLGLLGAVILVFAVKFMYDKG